MQYIVRPKIPPVLILQEHIFTNCFSYPSGVPLIYYEILSIRLEISQGSQISTDEPTFCYNSQHHKAIIPRLIHINSHRLPPCHTLFILRYSLLTQKQKLILPLFLYLDRIDWVLLFSYLTHFAVEWFSG